MARIRSKNTKPEKLLRSELWRRGLRYRIHGQGLPGRPDIVFRGPKVAVYVDGCFWHGCPQHYTFPRSRRDYWRSKLRRNVERDQNQTAELEREGWRVIRIWEHEIMDDLQQTADTVAAVVQHVEGAPRESWRVIAVEVLSEEEDMERRTLAKLRKPGEIRTEEGPSNRSSR